MKRLFALAAVAVAAVAIYAVTAPAGQQTLGSRVTNLEKKVKTLQKNYNSLASVVANCLLVEAVPLKQWGGANGEGYLYHQASAPSGTAVLTSALDFPEQGGQPNFWALSTSSQCASSINSSAAIPRIAAALKREGAAARPGRLQHRVATP